MKKKVAIYLAGSIQKGHKGNNRRWTEEDRQILREELADYSVTFLNPDQRSDDLSDQKSVFGRDMLQVFCSDLVFVDARERRGLGVGAEMMWAKANRIPVISWLPLGTHYRTQNTSILGVPVDYWVHPFVESLSDVLVDDLMGGAKWIRETLFSQSFKPKDLSFVHAAMKYYRDTQGENDLPMKEILSSNLLLKTRSMGL